MASHKSYRHRPGRAARDDGSGDEDPVVFFEAEPPGLDDPESAIEAADPPAGTQSSPEPEGAPRDSGPRAVIAVGSGKGGAGKSLLAASMGVYLAQLGKKVVLVDANLGSANLHTMVGVEEPKRSLHHFLTKAVTRLEEVVVPTPFEGLGLVAGHDDGVGSANPRPTQKVRLLSQLRALDTDYVVIDLPPGSGYNALDIFLAADLHVVVTVPEPPAIESAFRFIKSAFVRRVKGIAGVELLVEQLEPKAHCGIPTPIQLLQAARHERPDLVGELERAMEDFKPRLIVNKTRTREDLELGPALASVGRRHLGLPLDYLGYAESDDVAWAAVRRRRPLLVEYPEAKVCKDLERMARRIVALESKERPGCVGLPTPLALQNHYEILETHPSASDEEIRVAFRRERRLYDANSPAIFGIAPHEEVKVMHRRIDEAYSILVDPEKRHAYNQQLVPGWTPNLTEESVPGISLTLPVPPEVFLERPELTTLVETQPRPQVTADTEFTGALLRQIRESSGLDLEDVADRTKISIGYLRAIEDENFLSAPAPVYLRGFVKAVARSLRLDADHVARTYMARYEAARRQVRPTR